MDLLSKGSAVGDDGRWFSRGKRPKKSNPDRKSQCVKVMKASTFNSVFLLKFVRQKLEVSMVEISSMPKVWLALDQVSSYLTL